VRIPALKFCIASEIAACTYRGTIRLMRTAPFAFCFSLPSALPRASIDACWRRNTDACTRTVAYGISAKANSTLEPINNQIPLVLRRVAVDASSLRDGLLDRPLLIVKPTPDDRVLIAKCADKIGDVLRLGAALALRHPREL
jgi:hypothetical protein